MGAPTVAEPGRHVRGAGHRPCPRRGVWWRTAPVVRVGRRCPPL